MLFVLIGLGVVGLSSVLFGKKSESAPHPLTGDIIIVCAQLVVAVQMVVEEKFIGKYNIPPLQVVGWEGIFGFSILSCILVVMYYIPGSSAGNHFENTPDALVQFGNSWVIMISILGNILSIAFFNFFGISITKYASATTRMVIDSVRTLVIWAVGLAFFKEDFQYLQIVGFFFLILGTILYNEVLVIPFLGKPDPKPEHEGTTERGTTNEPTTTEVSKAEKPFIAPEETHLINTKIVEKELPNVTFEHVPVSDSHLVRIEVESSSSDDTMKPIDMNPADTHLIEVEFNNKSVSLTSTPSPNDHENCTEIGD